MRFFYVFLGTILTSMIVIKFCPFPSIIILFLFLFSFVFGSITLKKKVKKLICFNLALFSFIFLILEFVFMVSVGKVEQKYVTKDGYMVPDTILGYAPKKDIEVRVKKSHNNKIIYDVKYTITKDGLRFSGKEAGKSAVVFFGGSFTFGEGVENLETLPSQICIQSKYKYSAYNFGFHGYGPHQMLAAIENGLVKKIVRKDVKAGIYSAIFSHMDRAAGLTSWDHQGPKYTLNKENKLIYSGRFNDKLKKNTIQKKNNKKPSYLYLLLTHNLRKFYTLKKIEESYYKMLEQKKSSSMKQEKKLALFIAIIEKSKQLFEKHYPGSQFYVIYWDTTEKAARNTMIKKALKARNIPFCLVSKIIPDIKNKAYRIEHDGHPTTLANKKLAQYILKKFYDRIK